MQAAPSIVSRAVLAIVLMVGFYVLALGIAGGLLYIPYAEMKYANRLHIKLALFCVIGAVVIFWAIIPRIDKFLAPGPRLTPEEFPHLFREIESIAKATSQEMPAEVYAVHDVNAWVAERGGVMGWGSRRVMGLGLPLMRMLSISELRAVLAHEFGHFHGGDTKLGPWIYKTRGAILRTVNTLAQQGSIITYPFLWYAKLFLRITHAVSRRQEFVADEVAARTAGARPLISGLRTVHGVGPVFNPFWMNEVVPLLQAGYRPPVGEGFSQFVQAQPIAKAITEQVQAELESGQVDPYDTHPPLRERIAAVENLPPGEILPNDAAAVSLIDDVPALERGLLAAMFGDDAVEKLKAIGWDDAGAKVYVPAWTELLRHNVKALRGITPSKFPELAANLKQTATAYVGPEGKPPPEEARESLAVAVLGAALALALLQRGWQLGMPPGGAVTLRHGAVEIEAFNVIQRLAGNKITASEWLSQCAMGGITDIDLATVVTEAPPATP